MCHAFQGFSFGSIRINGITYEHDVVIDRGWVRKRKKKPSKKFRDEFGHTPLSLEEEIPWKCRRLIDLPQINLSVAKRPNMGLIDLEGS